MGRGAPGAGNAQYQSSLIQALRGSSEGAGGQQGAGVTMFNPAAGPAASSSGLPSLSTGGSFNPGVFTLPGATPQQIADWNSYNAYRTGTIGGGQQLWSFDEWNAERARRAAAPPPAPAAASQPYDPYSVTGGGA
jgi:hypothetical protein